MASTMTWMAEPAAIDHAPRDVDADPIAWREAGDGRPVLLLHGLGMTRTGWDAQLRALAGRGWRGVAWDMPGYGASRPAPGALGFPFLADAAAGLIAGLGGDAHVVGLSMGGQIALHLALRHPGHVRSLGLLDTSPAFGLDGTDPEEWRRLRLDPLDRGVTPAQMAERVLASVMAPDVSADALATGVASMARIVPAALRAAVECLPSHDVRARLGEIACPTLVVVGQRDEETPLAYSEELAHGIPGARLAVVPDAGHIVNLEAPDVVNGLLLDHLARAEAGAA